MFGLILGAGIPFLGPVIAAWITLIVGVMAAYFVLVVRYHGPTDVEDAPEWRRPMSVEPTERPAPWASPTQAVLARSNLPAYDMEDYPDDQWGRSSAAG